MFFFLCCFCSICKLDGFSCDELISRFLSLVLLTISRNNLLTLRSTMEMVLLLLRLRDSMHHYQGICLSNYLLDIFLSIFWGLSPAACQSGVNQATDDFMTTGHVYYIQIIHYTIQQRSLMISPNVVLRKLRSHVWTGVVESQWQGFLSKFLKVFKV